jgi:hypothetical protein
LTAIEDRSKGGIMDGNRHERNPDHSEPLAGEIIESRPDDQYSGWQAGGPFREPEGVGGWLFGPRSFGGGRVQVYGCSPGCIVLSLIVSLVLSILLTVLVNKIF